MKELKYTPQIIKHICSGDKLKAIGMAKELYGLSLQEAKEMINSYRPWLNSYIVNENGERTQETPEPQQESVTNNEDFLPYCCPNCGSNQVEKSLGGMLEHAAACGGAKLIKSALLGDYGGLTGGAENEIIKEEVPFQQACSYCHYTFHASKSQIEAGKYAMSKSLSQQLTEAYNRRLQSVKNGEVRRIKEAASKKLPRLCYAGVALLVGLLIMATCDHETTGIFGLPSYTWSFMFSCVLTFLGVLGVFIEGGSYIGKINEANIVDKMPIKEYAKNHKA